jgi:hypothetical protein
MPNALTAYNPQMWAYESLALLEEEMVAGSVVNRDFDSQVANFGDTVNTRRPRELKAMPWAKGDSVTDQDLIADNVQVKLDQIFDVSCVVNDVEATLSFKDIVKEFIRPAILPLARLIDRKVLGQVSQFLGNSTGGLGSLTKLTAQEYLVNTGLKLNQQKCPEDNRNLLMSAIAYAEMLKTDLFVSAEKAGQSDTQRSASLGPKFGIQNWWSLNVPQVVGGTTATAGTAGATAVGSMTVVVSTADIAAGQYYTVAGDMSPLRVASRTGTGPWTLTNTRPTIGAIAASAVVTPYAPGAVNEASGYAAGWYKYITVDGTGVPKVGQLVAFGTTAPEYVIVDIVGSTILLDRPLEAAVTDNTVVNYGPNGSYNLAYHPNAITLVNRPMATAGVTQSPGATIAVANSDNLSMRMIMSYDPKFKQTKMSFDLMFGIKTLDTNLGVPLLG